MVSFHSFARVRMKDDGRIIFRFFYALKQHLNKVELQILYDTPISDGTARRQILILYPPLFRTSELPLPILHSP
jgi:hypothetical protein